MTFHTGPVQRRLEEAIAAYGFARVHSYGKVVWRIVCDKCGVEVTAQGLPTNAPPEALLAKMRRLGWSVEEGRRPLCKSCFAQAMKGKRMKHEPKTDTAAAALMTGIGPDPKIALRVFRRLDEAFNESTRTYKPGLSDDKVAEEVGASVELVVKLRREAYGELAETPEMAAFRADLEKLKAQLADDFAVMKALYESSVAELEMRFAKLPGAHHKAAG